MATHSPHPIERLTQGRFPPVWFGLALIAVGIVSTAYVVTHAHPAYEGGLYLRIVEAIRLHGFALPSHISDYPVGGIPFAYPPLMFYVTAVIVQVTGVNPVWLMTVLPGILVLAYLVPYYLLAEEFLGTARRAGVATLIFGVAPSVLRWHLSSGGIVRAPAMFITLLGTLTALKLFRTGRTRWLVATTVLWALIIVTHPVYTTFLGFTIFLIYLWYDRSIVGLARGGFVALGGFILTSPWWLTVISRHGIGPFLDASNSRSTLGGGIHRLLVMFVWPITTINVIEPFFLLAFAGAIYAVYRRRYFLTVWLVTSSYLLGKHRFVFVPGAILATIFLFDVLVPAASRLGTRVDRGRLIAIGTAAFVIVGATGVGTAFASSTLDTAHGNSPTMPQTVRPSDEAAMHWVSGHTDPSATFYVIGDEAEWFPYYTNRSIAVSPWGTEWTPHFRKEVNLYLTGSACTSLTCLEGKITASGTTPQYVYVPTRVYTIRGEQIDPPYRMIQQMVSSSRYHLAYANDGVMIFKITIGPTDGQSVGTPTKGGRSGTLGTPTEVPAAVGSVWRHAFGTLDPGLPVANRFA